MSRHKVVFEFEGTVGASGTAGARAGWTETWYDTVDTTDALAAQRALECLGKRRALLTPGWSTTAIRISQLSPTLTALRKGALVFIPPQVGPGTYGFGVAGQDEQPYDAVEISIASVTGVRRAFQMRGIGQDVISPGGRLLNPPNFNNAFPNWVQWINGSKQIIVPGGPYAVRYRTSTVVNNLIGILIAPGPGSPVLVPSPQSPVINLPILGPVPIGTFVSITGTTGFQRLNGTWVVQNVYQGSANPPVLYSLQLAPKRRVTVVGSPVLLGTARMWQFALDPIAVATAGYGTSRRTGRPLQLTRGRRSNRPF